MHGFKLTKKDMNENTDLTICKQCKNIVPKMSLFRDRHNKIVCSHCYMFNTEDNTAKVRKN